MKSLIEKSAMRMAYVMALAAAMFSSSGNTSAVEADKAGKDYGRDNPYISGRVIHLGNANGAWWKAMFKEERGARYAYPLWKEEQLRQYVEMLHAFGFNGIEVWALDWEGLRYEEAAVTLCKAARELGMDTQLFMWGACGGIAPDGGISYKVMDWHKPEERAAVERFYDRHLFMAPYLTRVVTLWADPGQGTCPECTIETAVERHNSIAGRFRAKNPDIQFFFSTWFVGEKSWPQYAGAERLAANEKLDKASGIALPNAKDIPAVVRSGRPAGIWSWYTTDVEIVPRMSVILNRTTFRLPSDSRDKLSWFSVEDECQGLNIQNLFLAGSLMQNPWADAEKLLSEFVHAYVGKEAAPAVLEALTLVERYNNSLQLRYPAAPEEKAAIEQALARLQSLSLNPDHKPPWPAPLSPGQYVAEIRGRLSAMLEWTNFQEALGRLEKMQKDGVDAAAIQETLDRLPQVHDDQSAAASPEFWHFRELSPTLKKRFLEFPLLTEQCEGCNKFWSASSMLDGKATTGWCSKEGAKPPFDFIIDYGRTLDADAVVLDNSCQEDKYPGISARELSVYGGTESPHKCEDLIGNFELQKGMPGQRFTFAPRKVRFIRLTIHSNWGNENYTELMDFKLSEAGKK